MQCTETHKLVIQWQTNGLDSPTENQYIAAFLLAVEWEKKWNNAKDSFPVLSINASQQRNSMLAIIHTFPII